MRLYKAAYDTRPRKYFGIHETFLDEALSIDALLGIKHLLKSGKTNVTV